MPDRDAPVPQFRLDVSKAKPALRGVSLLIDADKAAQALQDGGCSICTSDLAEGEKAVKLDCGHMFHTDCIEQWLEKRPTCPLCRTVVFDHTAFIDRIVAELYEVESQKRHHHDLVDPLELLNHLARDVRFVNACAQTCLAVATVASAQAEAHTCPMILNLVLRFMLTISLQHELHPKIGEAKEELGRILTLALENERPALRALACGIIWNLAMPGSHAPDLVEDLADRFADKLAILARSDPDEVVSFRAAKAIFFLAHFQRVRAVLLGRDHVQAFVQRISDPKGILQETMAALIEALMLCLEVRVSDEDESEHRRQCQLRRAILEVVPQLLLRKGRVRMVTFHLSLSLSRTVPSFDEVQTCWLPLFAEGGVLLEALAPLPSSSSRERRDRGSSDATPNGELVLALASRPGAADVDSESDEQAARPADAAGTGRIDEEIGEDARSASGLDELVSERSTTLGVVWNLAIIPEARPELARLVLHKLLAVAGEREALDVQTRGRLTTALRHLVADENVAANPAWRDAIEDLCVLVELSDREPLHHGFALLDHMCQAQGPVMLETVMPWSFRLLEKMGPLSKISASDMALAPAICTLFLSISRAQDVRAWMLKNLEPTLLGQMLDGLNRSEWHGAAFGRMQLAGVIWNLSMASRPNKRAELGQALLPAIWEVLRDVPEDREPPAYNATPRNSGDSVVGDNVGGVPESDVAAKRLFVAVVHLTQVAVNGAYLLRLACGETGSAKTSEENLLKLMRRFFYDDDALYHVLCILSNLCESIVHAPEGFHKRFIRVLLPFFDEKDMFADSGRVSQRCQTKSLHVLLNLSAACEACADLVAWQPLLPPDGIVLRFLKPGPAPSPQAATARADLFGIVWNIAVAQSGAFNSSAASKYLPFLLDNIKCLRDLDQVSRVRLLTAAGHLAKVPSVAADPRWEEVGEALCDAMDFLESQALREAYPLMERLVLAQESPRLFVAATAVVWRVLRAANRPQSCAAATAQNAPAATAPAQGAAQTAAESQGCGGASACGEAGKAASRRSGAEPIREEGALGVYSLLLSLSAGETEVEGLWCDDDVAELLGSALRRLSSEASRKVLGARAARVDLVGALWNLAMHFENEREALGSAVLPSLLDMLRSKERLEAEEESAERVASMRAATCIYHLCRALANARRLGDGIWDALACEHLNDEGALQLLHVACRLVAAGFVHPGTALPILSRSAGGNWRTRRTRLQELLLALQVSSCSGGCPGLLTAGALSSGGLVLEALAVEGIANLGACDTDGSASASNEDRLCSPEVCRAQTGPAPLDLLPPALRVVLNVAVDDAYALRDRVAAATLDCLLKLARRSAELPPTLQEALLLTMYHVLCKGSFALPSHCSMPEARAAVEVLVSSPAVRQQACEKMVAAMLHRFRT
eukprot:TRINITY_DN29090_c0_g1_i1.p1 TRINITY_DN29090_c0_g1~~TRINITY_DN29090_c0_g1_i1.p1  ORF type:complete len:1467 (-),score=317.12 TRINITY_DN29090_c0_g1_i1:48-4256(-)